MNTFTDNKTAIETVTDTMLRPTGREDMSCFLCSNCTDCIDGNLVERSCMIVTDHDPSFCVEDLQLKADWKIVPEKVGEVSIRFNEKYTLPILQGYKTATTRTKIKGHIGDTFEVEGRRFRIFAVHELELIVACDSFYMHEGYHDLGRVSGIRAMHNDLSEIYPGITDTTPVFVHEFEEVME